MKRELIATNGRWIIATRRPATDFRTTGADIWMNPTDTEWICRVGEEDAVAELPPLPAREPSGISG